MLGQRLYSMCASRSDSVDRCMICPSLSSSFESISYCLSLFSRCAHRLFVASLQVAVCQHVAVPVCQQVTVPFRWYYFPSAGTRIGNKWGYVRLLCPRPRISSSIQDFESVHQCVFLDREAPPTLLIWFLHPSTRHHHRLFVT